MRLRITGICSLRSTEYECLSPWSWNNVRHMVAAFPEQDLLLRNRMNARQESLSTDRIHGIVAAKRFRGQPGAIHDQVTGVEVACVNEVVEVFEEVLKAGDFCGNWPHTLGFNLSEEVAEIGERVDSDCCEGIAMLGRVWWQLLGWNESEILHLLCIPRWPVVSKDGDRAFHETHATRLLWVILSDLHADFIAQQIPVACFGFGACMRTPDCTSPG